MSGTVVALALFAALLHATWNAFLHSGADRLWTITVMAFAIMVVAIPFAAILPFPPSSAWPHLILSSCLQVGYSVFLVSAYRHGELGQVYPIVRGSVPLLVTLGGFVFAGERLAARPMFGVKMKPGLPYMSMPEYAEEHDRGELLVAAFMNAFLDIWLTRLKKVGFIRPGKRDRSITVEEGARVADHLLTMAIRAIDYCPPTDLTFADYLSALLTVDREVVPDDSKYDYRVALLKNFRDFDISPAAGVDTDGTWKRCEGQLVYSRARFESLVRDRHEVFRLIWENRAKLNIGDDGYIEVQSVRPSIRIGPDGLCCARRWPNTSRS